MSRLRPILAPAALILGVLAIGPAGAETPEEIFHRGNEAYEQERYAEAAEAYRTVLKYRVRDPRVEYNLGNAEFRLGNLGEAILHFERAHRLAPADREIRENLDYARTLCFDRVEPPSRPAWLAWVVNLQDRLGPGPQAWSAVVLVWIAGAVFVGAFARPGAWRPAHGWALAGLLLAFALIVGSWYVTHQRLRGTRSAVVLADAVEVRAGPGDKNPSLFTVHEGLTIEVLDARKDWVQVSLPNGLNGWLPSAALGLV